MSCTNTFSLATSFVNWRQYIDIAFVQLVSRYLMSGDACSSNSDCKLIGNSTCNNGKCQCSGAGYQPNTAGTRCSLRSLNDTCSTNDQCSLAVSHSFCGLPAGRCQCTTGYKTSDDGSKCDRKLINDLCDNNADCATVIENAECREGRCVCKMLYRTSADDKTTCQPIPINELPCTSNAQCSHRASNVVCGINGTCECGCGTVISIDGTSCIKLEVSSPF